MESATPDRGVLDSGPDLIAIEADYRAGVMSVRAIAAKHGVSESVIRKWAKNADPPWQRDLTGKVQEAARAQIVRSAHHAYDGVRTPTERELIDAAARSIVQVVREHRGAIQAGQQMVGMLLGQLQDVATHRERIEEIILEETSKADGEGKAADGEGRRRAVMMRAVSLPAHAGVIKDLATAMKHLIGLERQAFGIVDKEEDPPPLQPVQGGAALHQEDKDFAALRERFAARAGVITDAEPRQPAAAA